MKLKLLYLAMVTTLVTVVTSKQHVLLDTTKESMLDWFKYPKGPQSPTPGWVEESFNNYDKGINWRSYVVCDVGYPSVNNWLWTPFIEREEADRFYIEVKYSMRNCDIFPAALALHCKETFDLFFYEFDPPIQQDLEYQPPPWEPEAYKLIDTIGPENGRFTPSNEVIINTATRSVEVTKKEVYFAFRDRGACLSLLAIKGFATYPETPTGKTEGSINKVYGSCIRNAVSLPEARPFSFCKTDGTWSHSDEGGCHCMAGYQADHSTSSSCEECPIGKYKSEEGSAQCRECPPHSRALFQGSIECSCSKGYYRSHNDPPSSACTRPPTTPRNVTATKVSSDTVTLSWSPPRDEGGRSDTVYRLVCSSCGPEVHFDPESPTFAQTFVSVSSLSPNTDYKFEVIAENGVSSNAKELPQVSEVFITTEQGNQFSLPNLLAWLEIFI